MALRPATIRFSRDAYDLVQKAAEQVGVSMSQYAAEAALTRAVLQAAADGDGLAPEGERVRDFGALAEEVSRLASIPPGDGVDSTV